MVAPLVIGALAGLGALSGGLNASAANRAAFKQRQQQSDFLYRGLEQLDPGHIAGAFGQLQGLQGGFLNQMLSSQGLAGQMASGGIQASLGRAGLGSTGLGQALGQGAQMGAAFQGNTLRSRMMMDLLQEAFGLQQSRANPFFQAMNAVPGGPNQSVFGGAAGGAAGVLGMFGMGQQSGAPRPGINYGGSGAGTTPYGSYQWGR